MFRALGFAAVAAAGAAHAQTSIRYDFGLAVTENTFDDLGIPGDLQSVQIGETGSFFIEVDAVTPPFDNVGGPIYEVLDVGANFGPISNTADSSRYPASGYGGGFSLVNDGDSAGGGLVDSVVSVLFFDNPEFGFTNFQLNQTVPNGSLPPTLFDSSELPRDIDFSLADANSGLYIQSSAIGATGGRGRLVLSFTSVDVTLIPAPGSVAVLGLGVFVATRRRR